jgi:hypothetical protein
MAAYADVAQKTDTEDAEFEKDSQVLEALEADLAAAQAAFDAAEAHYNLVARSVAKEMAKPTTEEATVPKTVFVEEKEVDAEGKVAASAEQKLSEPVPHGQKNTSALTTKEISREKWEAKHSREIRVREATKKYKEKMRRGARDAKYAQAEVDVAEAETPTGGDTPAAQPTAETAQEDGSAIDDGAKSIAERMKSLKDLPSAADQRGALLKVMTGSRDNYFSSDPAEVVLDLEARSLVAPALASEMMALLNEVAPVKGPALTPDQWLEHAKKVAALQRPDEKAFTANEFAYLKSIDNKHLKEAESELATAEAQLATLLQLSESWYPAGEDSSNGKPAAAPVAEVKVDLDKAAILEDQQEKKAESRGMKNTSALPSKVVSKEKWLSQRGQEQRTREKGVKARQARRAECLERKMEAAA